MLLENDLAIIEERYSNKVGIKVETDELYGDYIICELGNDQFVKAYRNEDDTLILIIEMFKSMEDYQANIKYTSFEI